MTQVKLFVVTIVFISGAIAFADWDPVDPYKMHYPQMPDPYGWDVDFGPNVPQLADDWLCSESGWVDDFHLWVSWKGDLENSVTGVYATIYTDDRTGPYSKPGTQVWSGLFKSDSEEFKIRHYGTGDQGWYDPVEDIYIVHDHNEYYQINITNIESPFYQEEGNIYWLGVCVTSEEQVGWKTSLDHFEDDAVWWDGSEWQELRDPLTDESLDLSFVITPEPTSLLLFAIGSAFILKRRRT